MRIDLVLKDAEFKLFFYFRFLFLSLHQFPDFALHFVDGVCNGLKFIIIFQSQ